MEASSQLRSLLLEGQGNPLLSGVVSYISTRGVFS